MLQPVLPPRELARYIPAAHHDQLAAYCARWAKHGISFQEIERHVRRCARLNPVPARNRQRWAIERRRLRSLRGQLVTVLKKVCAVYDELGDRAESVPSPIEKSARAILDCLARAEQAKFRGPARQRGDEEATVGFRATWDEARERAWLAVKKGAIPAAAGADLMLCCAAIDIRGDEEGSTVRQLLNAVLDKLPPVRSATPPIEQDDATALDFADPFMPPVRRRRGPQLLTDDARRDLVALGVSNRTAAWLAQVAVLPPGVQ